MLLWGQMSLFTDFPATLTLPGAASDAFIDNILSWPWKHYAGMP